MIAGRRCTLVGSGAAKQQLTISIVAVTCALTCPGRQLLIARVGKEMRDLVTADELVRISGPAGRKTARYAVA